MPSINLKPLFEKKHDPVTEILRDIFKDNNYALSFLTKEKRHFSTNIKSYRVHLRISDFGGDWSNLVAIGNIVAKDTSLVI